MKIEILRNSDENDKIISKQQDEALYIYMLYRSLHNYISIIVYFLQFLKFLTTLFNLFAIFCNV